MRVLYCFAGVSFSATPRLRLNVCVSVSRSLVRRGTTPSLYSLRLFASLMDYSVGLFASTKCVDNGRPALLIYECLYDPVFLADLPAPPPRATPGG